MQDDPEKQANNEQMLDSKNVTTNVEAAAHNTYNIVTWGDVSEENIMNDDPKLRVPKRQVDVEEYQFTNIGQDMDNFLMA